MTFCSGVRWSVTTFIVCLGVTGISGEALAVSPCNPSTSECRFHFEIPGSSGRFINYFGNYDISQANLAIKKIVIAIEGNSRDAKGLYKTMYSVTNAQKLLGETLVIAPWIKANDYSGQTNCTDSNCDAVEANEVYWSSDGWKQGDAALVAPLMSTFSVTDLLVQSLVGSKLFGSLQGIVLTGHSAGGQFTQRYALGTMVDETIKPVTLEYVVANPSSYLYLDNFRPTWAGLYTSGGKYPEYGLDALAPLTPPFIDPYLRASSPYVSVSEFATIKDSLNSVSGSSCGCSSYPCPYERFKYGFDMKPKDSSHYMCFESAYQTCDRHISANDQMVRFLSRRVTYVLGQLDNSTPSGSPDAATDLDVRCGANMQGPDRLSRGTYYYESLSRLGAHNHRILFASQVGHSASQLYPSYPAKRAVFGGDLPVKQYMAPTYRIRQQATGRYLDAGTSSPYGSMTQTLESNLTQRWILTKVSGNEYTIQQEHTLRYLEAATSSGYAASTQEYKTSPVQLWILVPVVGQAGTYTIQQKANSRYLDANTSSGYSVNTQSSQTDGTQYWVIQP